MKWPGNGVGSTFPVIFEVNCPFDVVSKRCVLLRCLYRGMGGRCHAGLHAITAFYAELIGQPTLKRAWLEFSA